MRLAAIPFNDKTPESLLDALIKLSQKQRQRHDDKHFT